MSNIILKIPEGKKCLSCMFLDIDYMHNMPKCNLFKEKLRAQMEYGQLDETTIEKTHPCPTDT